MIEIINYHPDFKQDFIDLNIEWISNNFVVEEHDREQLEHAEEILSNGGMIFFAKYDDKIIGTVALIKINETDYELAKMAVSPVFRGKGAGKLLGEHAIEAAKNAGCKYLFLESNQKLTPALKLYKKLGFVEVPVGETPYARANFKGEIFFE